LKVAGTAAGMATLAACQPAPTAAPTTAPTQAPAPTVAPTKAPEATKAPAAPTATTAPAGPKRGGKITWAVNQDFVNVAPFGIVNTANMWGKEFMYDGLTEWDRNLVVKPALAESWETPDDKTWIFHLRKDVKFYNGDDFTAEDVKYSCETANNPPPPGVKNSFFANFVSAEVIDKNTVKLNMKGPDPTILGYFAWQRYCPIAPKNADTRWNLLTTGVGTGPFRLVEYVPNDHITYTRNDGFWKPGLPYLQDLILKVLPDPNAAVAALRSGAIDGCTVTADVANTLKSDPNLVVLKGLYSAPDVLQFTIKGDDKPWNKKEVRQAINLCLNRQDIIDKVFAGQAVPTGPIPPQYGDWFLPDATLKKYQTQDVAKAKELMKTAGFANGFPITLHSISIPDYHVRVSEIVKESLKQIGVEVTIVAEEIGAFAKRVGDGTFDFCKTGRGMRHDPSGYTNDFGATSIGSALYWFNTLDQNKKIAKQGWNNPEATDLYAKALVNLDSKTRHEQYARIQEIVLDEVPHIYLCQQYKFQVVRKRVQNMYVAFTDFNGGLREAWVTD